MRMTMTTMLRSMTMTMGMTTMRQSTRMSMTTMTIMPNILMRMDQAHLSGAQTSRDSCKRVISPMIAWRCLWPGSLTTSQVMKERILALA